jgi:hypothetical protein
MITTLTLPILNTKPPFSCVSCGYRDTYYQTALKSMFKVEPMAYNAGGATDAPKGEDDVKG